jgi:hypothetical protein
MNNLPASLGLTPSYAHSGKRSKSNDAAGKRQCPILKNRMLFFAFFERALQLLRIKRS